MRGKDVFPADYRTTVAYANQLFEDYLRTVETSRQLTPEELERISGVIRHLRSVWNVAYTRKPISSGIKILQKHFARKFNLDLSATYGDILEPALPGGYFQGRDPFDHEVIAFSQLMAYNPW